jgi:hypothetical protein
VFFNTFPAIASSDYSKKSFTMSDPPKSAWPDFHIAVISKGGTLYPSFPSKKISGGDADKITLLQIREVAGM